MSLGKFLAKLRGDGEALPARASFRAIALAGLGGCIAIATLGLLTDRLSLALLLGSFGASSMTVFGFPDLTFSQPRNIIGGHFLSALSGLLLLTVAGPHWWAAGLAVGLAMMLMMLSRTVHPPAASNPVIVFLLQPGWDFLFFPALAGAVLLVAIAVLYNNATRAANYPKYWL